MKTFLISTKVPPVKTMLSAARPIDCSLNETTQFRILPGTLYTIWTWSKVGVLEKFCEWTKRILCAFILFSTTFYNHKHYPSPWVVGDKKRIRGKKICKLSALLVGEPPQIMAPHKTLSSFNSLERCSSSCPFWGGETHDGGLWPTCGSLKKKIPLCPHHQ